MIQAQSDLDEWNLELMLDAARAEWGDPNHYRQLPAQDSCEGYGDMQEYIWSLEEAHLHELLETAIHGSGAFRRFKDTLHRYPEAKAEWFKFRDACEHERVLEWFEGEEPEPEFV